MRSQIFRLGAVLVLLLAAMAGCAAANPDRLWQIVHGECVPDQLQHGQPAPCDEVVLAGGEERGYVILKDLVGASQFLLIPTRQLSGIESPELLDPAVPNYWQAAWQARHHVVDALGRTLPRDAVGLAVNSPASRSQNQLHIHIDCLFAEVRDALRQHERDIGASWSETPLVLRGHPYRAMRVQSDELADIEPFRLLAAGLSSAVAPMAERTLVVAGASFADGTAGFYLLTDHIDIATHDAAGGEELLDHGCAIAQ